MAETTIPAPSPEVTPRLEVPSGAAYNHWRKTGELPATEVQPKTEEAAPSKDSSASLEKSETNVSDKSASASEAGRLQERAPRKRSTAEDRIGQLSRELGHETVIKMLLNESKRRKSPPDGYTVVTQAESSPAKPAPIQQTKTISQLVEPKEPLLADFENKPYGEWEVANRKYNRELADYMSKKAVQEYQQQQEKDSAQREFNAKVNAGRERYEDFDEVVIPAAQAIMSEQQIRQDIKELINDSPVFTDLLYVLGGDKTQFNDFLARAKNSPREAIMLIAATERMVIEELSKKKVSASESNDVSNVPERGEDGKFKSSTHPEKKVTSAPPIGSQVNSSSAPGPDAVESAVKKGDFSAYAAAKNLEDIESLKRRKR